MTIPIKSRTPAYAQENGSILIDVHISSMDQFYNLLDPSPEEEKDLDEETETYIRNAVEDLTPDERKRARIVLYLSPHLYQNSSTRKNMERAVTANFAYRLYHENRKYAFALERGRRYLLRGLIFLVLCLVISSVFTRIFEENDVNLALAQSFVIIGWVALWKPVEFYLYDRRDLLDDLAVLEALTAMPVESRKGTTVPENETLVLM
ncbi:hypothetical protein [Methanocorpusculum vombati]|uniref:Uncharacterized protein n=1 Tax=Methanocorpusculum vombati TaxID=3002864 RepID=A0ABT4ILA2_9EURY|nr:hypothetical protein [Methanocorpusculum vombati]MCZ9318807.1 hypothetical protein [Methanocorpusculum sp.]MCZ0862544.1 hypothetical protein [Methanocorpusculum vombati]MDE2521449.1 hypothetical protein [Methanocorpusculum sp.]MDE2533935.1 hypothetical protein [Methanocorpusculum sp.]MDE2546865.1 hypothetical protein [Methanocorpusculum sp.]